MVLILSFSRVNRNKIAQEIKAAVVSKELSLVSGGKFTHYMLENFQKYNFILSEKNSSSILQLIHEQAFISGTMTYIKYFSS